MKTTSTNRDEWDHLAIRLAEAITYHDLQTVATLTANLSAEETAVLTFTLARMLSSLIAATDPRPAAERYALLYEMYPPA